MMLSRRLPAAWRGLPARCYSSAGASATRVTKFGGSSVAGSTQTQEVMDLLHADATRKFTVVSAPGKRFDGDIKVTDLLYQCHDLAAAATAATGGGEYAAFFDENVGSRYREISSTLGAAFSAELDADLEAAKGKIFDMAVRGDSPDFAASRGEALCGRLVGENTSPHPPPQSLISMALTDCLCIQRTFSGGSSLTLRPAHSSSLKPTGRSTGATPLSPPSCLPDIFSGCWLKFLPAWRCQREDGRRGAEHARGAG